MFTHSQTGFWPAKRLLPFLLLLGLSKPLSAQEANGYVVGEVLAGIRADKDDAGLAQRLAFVGADVEQITHLHIHRLRLLPGFTVPLQAEREG